MSAHCDVCGDDLAYDLTCGRCEQTARAEAAEAEVAALREKLAEAEKRSEIDWRQCDDMTAEAGRLAERLAEAERRADWLYQDAERKHAQIVQAERQLEQAREAFRQARDCCARPPGVCFPLVEEVQGQP